MDLSLKSGQLTKQRTACMVVGIFDHKKLTPSAEILDQACEGRLSALLKKGDLEGKLGQYLVLYDLPHLPCERLLLVGCGKERELGDKAFRELMGKVVNYLNELGATEAVNTLLELSVKGRDMIWKIRQAAERSLDALYVFDAFKSKKDTNRRPLKKMILSVESRKELNTGEQALQEGIAIAQGLKWYKDIANTPANVCTPAYLAEQAELLAQSAPEQISYTLLDQDALTKEGLNTLLAVGSGSAHPPRLAILRYNADLPVKPIVLVGKGITFDSGGYSMKSPDSMLGMKYDMSGAACVLAVLKTVVQLKLPISLTVLTPIAENMVDANAIRPDDIVKTLSGTTVEIRNTDAEGRLILCDALTYAERFQPDVVIDVATLTGACIVALGYEASGLLSNHNPLANDLLQAGQYTYDRAWQLPLWEEYAEDLKSPYADLSNVGGRAGTITAASFLAHFCKKFHWAHLDVAGTACVFDGGKRGSTGRPLPLLVHYLLTRAAEKKAS